MIVRILLGVLAFMPLLGFSWQQPVKNGDRVGNGFYLVLRSDTDQKKLLPLKNTERLLVQDFKFMAKADRPDPQFVVVGPQPDVPLVLAGDAKGKRNENGNMVIYMDLAPAQKENLARFTRKNVNKAVAVVIDGAVITTHSIREPITGGKVMISRCSDNGCEYLLKLLKEKK